MTIPQDFDWKFYVDFYNVDFYNYEIKTENSAKKHYIDFGKRENRIYNDGMIIDINNITNICCCSNGLGDILLYLLIFYQNKTFHYDLDENILLSHRTNHIDYKLFINELMSTFDVSYAWTKDKDYIVPNKIFGAMKNDDKQNCFKNKHEITNKLIIQDIVLPCEKYIIIHTKCRLDNKWDYSILFTIDKFFKTYQCKYPIMLLGERDTSKTYENRYHNVQNMYHILTQLYKNNTVFDYTVSIDIQNKPDFEQFRKDVTYINNALCNVNFGIGGNYVMSCIFSEKVISYVENSKYHFLNMCDNSINCVKWFDMEKALNALNTLNEL